MLMIFFFLSSFKEHLHLFGDYMNKQHRCLKFTSEIEHDNSSSFLDIEITRHNQQFKTYVHRKSTFSGAFTHEGYLDQSNKKSIFHTLLLLCYLIYSDYTLFDLEVENLRKILEKEQLTIMNYRAFHKVFFQQTLCSKKSNFTCS